MDRSQLWRSIRRVWVTLGISFTVIFVGWSLLAYRASAEARLATRSDSTVAVSYADGIWAFVPRRSVSIGTPALILFPGALVDPVAYAPLVRAAATAGFPAFLVELPRRGVFGGAESLVLERRFDRLLAASGTPRHWVIAGHSRGAVVASQVAAERRTGFVGLVVIGSSHPRDVDLSSLTVPVTKIVGTRDGLASRAEVEANRAKAPAATHWVWVEGGNHSQFGWYGFQPGDRRATIPAPAQRAMMIEAVIAALRHAAARRPTDTRDSAVTARDRMELLGLNVLFGHRSHEVDKPMVDPERPAAGLSRTTLDGARHARDDLHPRGNDHRSTPRAAGAWRTTDGRRHRPHPAPSRAPRQRRTPR